MPAFNVDFEVYCATCGDGLCNQSEGTKTRNRGELCVRVEACKTCLDNAKDEGFSKGYSEGHADAEKELAVA